MPAAEPLMKMLGRVTLMSSFRGVRFRLFGRRPVFPPANSNLAAMQAAAFDSQRFAYVLVAALVVGRFLFRELRERKMRVKTVYVLPIIVGAVALYAIGLAYFLVPALVLPLAIGCVSALAVGGAIGVAVAHLTTVRVTDDRSVVYVRGSY